MTKVIKGSRAGYPCIDREIGKKVYAYHNDLLTEEEIEKFEEHLFLCSMCKKSLLKLQWISNTLRATPEKFFSQTELKAMEGLSNETTHSKLSLQQIKGGHTSVILGLNLKRGLQGGPKASRSTSVLQTKEDLVKELIKRVRRNKRVLEDVYNDQRSPEGRYRFGVLHSKLYIDDVPFSMTKKRIIEIIGKYRGIKSIRVVSDEFVGCRRALVGMNSKVEMLKALERFKAHPKYRVVHEAYNNRAQQEESRPKSTHKR